MRVDRERFLSLVAFLATSATLASACGASQTTPPNEPGPSPAGAGAPEPVTIPIASAAPAPSASSSASAPNAPREATPAEIESARALSQPPSEPPKAPNPYDGTPVKAQSCNPADNKIGTLPACTLSAPGPTCESIADTKHECPTLATLLKPRVAQAAIECLRRRSGTKAICEFNVTSICAYEALGSACLDPSAKAACDGVIQRCGAPHGNYNKMTRDSCEAGVSGIADAKRKKFISCITESCRFETCLTYL
jgi:hypothetical protein